MFFDEERNNNHFLDVCWDNLERTGSIVWEGSPHQKYRIPAPESPFRPREGVKGKEQLSSLFQSGNGKEHSCVQRRIPYNIHFRPFAPVGEDWPTGGEDGFECTIRITLCGMVQQDTPGRWQWVLPLSFELLLPRPYRPILGDSLMVDGWFRFLGDKACRKQKRFIFFRAKNEEKLLKGVPEGTTVTIEWDEFLIPAPCRGVTLWGAYAVLEKMSGLGKTIDWGWKNKKRGGDK